MRFEKNNLVISTVLACDTGQYETAIAHPKYNEGNFIIVEEYLTESDANNGHNKWVRKMTKEKLPNYLEDVSTCTIKQLIGLFQNKPDIYKRSK